LAAALLSWPRQARADEMEDPVVEPLPERFAALAAVASAVRVEGAWDGGFGAEIGVGRLRRAGPVAGWAVSAGILGFSRRSGGRAWAEGSLALAGPFGVRLGLGAGPAVELDDIRLPRWGGQVTAWVFAAVVPYVRVGHLQEGGTFVDAGVRIPFPVVRW